MKKCLMLFFVLIAALAISIISEGKEENLPEDMLVINKVTIVTTR